MTIKQDHINKSLPFNMERLVHPVGFGKKNGDIMSWFKQMPTFIFGIVS